MAGDLSKAIARILFEDNWKQVAEACVSSTDEKTEKVKSDEMFKIYEATANVYLLVPESKMSSKYVPKLVNTMLQRQIHGKSMSF